MPSFKELKRNDAQVDDEFSDGTESMNMALHTTDNNCGKSFLELCGTEKMPHEISAVEKENLSAAFRHLSNIANVPLSELVKQNQSLLVFPQSFSEHNDEIDK